MHATIFTTFILQSIVSLVVVTGALNATRVYQNGCYNTKVMLNCPHYSQPKPGVPKMLLIWSKVKSGKKKLAKIESGEQKMYGGITKELLSRLALHRNGSLGISSLHPDDEAVYECRVWQGILVRKTYQIKLSVACGKVTVIKREVCVEEDVTLECDAKHRTNPRKLKGFTWKKETKLENGSSYTKVNNYFQVHANGSLLLPKGRNEEDVTFRCVVTKNDGTKDDKHFIRVNSVKCHNETPRPATVKTTEGRVSMTTASPAKGINVTMETTTRQPPYTTVQDVLPTQGTMICGSVLKDPVGTFQSPNFPSPYPANSHCKWTINVPQDYAAINITLDRVNLEHEDDCQNDYITIYDELGNQIGCRICGTRKSPVKIQVKGTEAVVAFNSDNSVNKLGFKIDYKAVRKVGKSVL